VRQWRHSQDIVEGLLLLPWQPPISYVKIIPQHLTGKMQGADAQASWRNLGTNIELLTLVGPGLGGVAERSVVEIVGACRSRGPADVDLRSGTGGIKCQSEVNFITGTNVAREDIRYQDSAAFTQDTGGLLAFSLT
jgi:hypothetical protein